MRLIFICFIYLSAGWVVGKEIVKIGIVGGGIGGTSCAYFIESLFGSKAKIDLYEAEMIGGRLSSVAFAGKVYEEGGSVIHSSNKYMVQFLEEFQLRTRENDDGHFALYDGSEFVFSESNWALDNLLRIIARYGYVGWKLRSHISKMVESFERIYKLQDEGMTFTTVREMMKAIDPKFADYLHVSTKVGFESEGINGLVLDEIVMATIRTNYGQDLSIQKMVGSISVAGVIGNLWSVYGGNYKLPHCLLRRSDASLIKSIVHKIRRTPTGQIEIMTKENINNEEEETIRSYDIVIVATPQTSDSKYKIEFENFEEEIKFPGRYHKTVCTLVHGNLSESYFPSKRWYIDEILSTTVTAPFNAIGKITPVDFGFEKDRVSNVWKIFTQEKMTDSQLNELFPDNQNVYVREWLAYPHYDHSIRNDSFVLAPNLYHINAIEWAASAMEMSAIGARNVALLAYKNYFYEKRRDDGSEDGEEKKDEL